METADKIRLHRKSAGLKQSELAERCGVCVSYISAYELGKRTPTLETILMFAKGLGVNPLSLLPDWFVDNIITLAEE